MVYYIIDYLGIISFVYLCCLYQENQLIQEGHRFIGAVFELCYHRIRKNMHLCVDQAMDTLKSSILQSSHEHSFCLSKPPKHKQSCYAKMENGLLVFKLQRRFLLIQYAFMLLLTVYFVLLISYVQSRLSQYQSDLTGNIQYAQLLLWALLSNSIGLIFCCVFRFLARRQLSSVRSEEQMTKFQLGLEILLYTIQPYPGLSQLTIDRYSFKLEELNPLKVNHLLIIFSLLKSMFYIRGMLNCLTPYSNPRYFRVTRMYGTANNHLYYLRCIFRQHPVLLISGLYIFGLFLFAFCFFILENGARDQASMNYMENTLWAAVLTMTSVGYGDVRPETSLGGIVTFVSSFSGVIGTSLFVLSITTNLELNYGEQRSLQILNRFKYRKEQKIKSGLYIRIALWRVWTEYKTKKAVQISPYERQLKRQLVKNRLDSKNHLKQSSLFQECMQQQFEITRSHLSSILQNCEELVSDCTKRKQVIEGVLGRLQGDNSSLKKIGLQCAFMSDRQKTLRDEFNNKLNAVSLQRASCFI